MTILKTLTKPQWDAANAAAKLLTEGDINNPEHRLSYRQARDTLVALLPDDVDARDVIGETVSRRLLDSITDIVVAGPGTIVIFGGGDE